MRNYPTLYGKGGKSKDQRSTSLLRKRKENQKVTDNSLRERIQGNWKQLSGGVRHEWGKLSHNDVEQVKGDVEVLAGKIEERYGVTKAEARKQIEQWANKIHTHQMEQSQSDTPAN
jgi:uncharacterized protein YjbJ (UPF0337 family)